MLVQKRSGRADTLEVEAAHTPIKYRMDGFGVILSCDEGALDGLGRHSAAELEVFRGEGIGYLIASERDRGRRVGTRHGYDGPKTPVTIKRVLSSHCEVTPVQGADAHATVPSVPIDAVPTRALTAVPGRVSTSLTRKVVAR